MGKEHGRRFVNAAAYFDPDDNQDITDLLIRDGGL